MYKKNPFLQFAKSPMDAVSPSKMQMGLVDRLKLAKGAGAVAGVAAHLAQTGLKTPWTIGAGTGKGVAKAGAKAVRAAESAFTRGASEISHGISRGIKKLKFW